MRKNLLERRIKLGFTQGEVAVKAGISRAYYTNIEVGRKDPSSRVMKRIADALKGSIDHLFFENEVPKRNESKSTA